MDVLGILCGMLFWGPVMLAWIAYLRSGKPSKPVRYVGTLFCIVLPLFIAACMAKGMLIDDGLADAVQAKDLGRVRVYIALGANPNNYDENRTPPLAQAAGDGQEEIVRLLLARGADVHAKGPWSWNNVTALTAAKVNGYDNIVKILKQAEASH
jgi:ankyrin repeat protein